MNSLTVIKSIIISWQESLSVFLPKNLKIFVLITLKSIIRTIKALIIGAWPLVIICSIFIAISPWLLHPSYHLLSNSLWIFLIIAAARPSTGLKDIWYFFTITYKYILFLFCWLALLLLSIKITNQLSYAAWPLFYQVVFEVFFMVPFYLIATLTLLFVLDAGGYLKSMLLAGWRAAKMFLYNYPLYVILILILTTAAHSNISIAVILEFFIFIILTNFYVKRLHEQNRVYYEI